MRVEEALNAGFSRTHAHFGLVVLDLVWKAIWLVLSGAMLLAFLVWLNGELGSIEVNSASSLQTPISMLIIARQIWAQYASTFFTILLIFVAISALVWILLESYFRAGVLPDSNEPFTHRASRRFRTFFAFALLKQLVMSSVGLLIGVIVFGKFVASPVSNWRTLWSDSGSSVLMAAFICIAVWLVLTIFETVVRADAVDLLGRELFTLVGIVTTLAVFEGLIVTSVAMTEWIITSIVSSAAGVLFFLMTLALSIAFLSVLHGYLMVTRYSAVSILSRTTSVPSSAVIMGHVNEL